MDNLEMRLQVLESRIYGEKRSKSAKPVKVGWLSPAATLVKSLGRC